jgi:hypothetical protein
MDYSKYENKMEYPSAPKKQCSTCSKRFSQDDNFCSKCGTNVGDEYREAMNHFKVARKRYEKENYRLHKLFQEDALDWIGLGEHHKRNYIFEYVWEREKDNGLQSVVEELEAISELF